MILIDYLPSTLAGLSAVCFGIVTLALEPRLAPQAALSVGMIFMGISLAATPLCFMHPDGDVPWLARFPAVTLGVAQIAMLEGFARLAWRPDLKPEVRRALVGCRAFFVATAIVGMALGLAFPGELANDYCVSIGDPGVLSRPGFWMFAIVHLLLAAAGIVLCAILLTQTMTTPLRSLALGCMVGIPFLAASQVLPLGYSALANLAGQVIVGVGLARLYVRNTP